MAADREIELWSKNIRWSEECTLEVERETVAKKKIGSGEWTGSGKWTGSEEWTGSGSELVVESELVAGSELVAESEQSKIFLILNKVVRIKTK